MEFECCGSIEVVHDYVLCYPLEMRSDMSLRRAIVMKTEEILQISVRNVEDEIAAYDFSDDIALEELDSTISSLDPRKSPGIDLIFGSMIKHFGILARSILLRNFNLTWSTGKLPTIWKMSVTVPILKPGKDAASCKNFRPICLTNTLSKILKQIIHFPYHKLAHQTESITL
ncbi:reverse transcriptase domain-containing protein [Trichonephila clavipes]|nr:reverse transcriptase domain-containing protein [Trichonephila clavipes]